MSEDIEMPDASPHTPSKQTNVVGDSKTGTETSDTAGSPRSVHGITVRA